MTCSEIKDFEHTTTTIHYTAAKLNGLWLEFAACTGALIEARIDDSFRPTFV